MMVGDEYNKKLLLGGIIAKTDVEKKKILQDSLSCEYKDALDLYWNKKQLMNIDNVILKNQKIYYKYILLIQLNI